MACNCNNRNTRAWTDSNGCLRLNLNGRNFTYCPEGVSVACDPNGEGILINGQLCPFPEPGEANIVTDLEFDSDTNILTLRQENGPPVTVNLDDLADDNYVESATFDSSTSELVLNRTGDLPQIRVEIPTLGLPEGDPFDVIQYDSDGEPVAGKVAPQNLTYTAIPSGEQLGPFNVPGMRSIINDTFYWLPATHINWQPDQYSIAVRDRDGTLKAAPAVDDDDLVVLSQLENLFQEFSIIGNHQIGSRAYDLSVEGLATDPSGIYGFQWTNDSSVTYAVTMTTNATENFTLIGNGECQVRYRFSVNGGTFSINARPESRSGADVAFTTTSSDRETYVQQTFVNPGDTITWECTVEVNVDEAFEEGSELLVTQRVNMTANPGTLITLEPIE